jgi:hypothetical protein
VGFKDRKYEKLGYSNSAPNKKCFLCQKGINKNLGKLKEIP